MQLLVYGSGGFGKEVVDIAERINDATPRWSGIAFVDDFRETGQYYGVPLHRIESVLEIWGAEDCEVVVAVGEPSVRSRLFGSLRARGLKLATLVDPTSVISRSASLGMGVIVTSYCSVASSAVVGDNVVLNAKAIVGHDVKIGADTVVSSMVNVGGACTIGACSYIGMAAQIKQGLSVGDRTIIGMGSMVHDSVGDDLIAMGNPARPMRRNVDNVVFR